MVNAFPSGAIGCNTLIDLGGMKTGDSSILTTQRSRNQGNGEYEDCTHMHITGEVKLYLRCVIFVLQDHT